MKFDRYEGANGFDDTALEEWCKERGISAGLGYAVFELGGDHDECERRFNEWQAELAELPGSADGDEAQQKLVTDYGFSAVLCELAGRAEADGHNQLAIELYKLSIQNPEV